jgi:lipopolysaccharide export system permease protein
VIDAERAVFQKGEWRLQKGNVTTFSAEDDFPTTSEFDEKTLKLSETPKDFTEIEKEVNGLRLKDLWRYIAKSRQAGADTHSNEVKFHSRVSLSFVPMVMCVLAFPFSVRSRREGGFAKDLGLCLMITFFYWLLYSVGLSLGSNGTVNPVVAAWAPTWFFAILAVGFLSRLRT